MPETDLLSAYLAEERLRPFEWSSLDNGDCQLFLLGWVERVGWPDAGKRWRGRYSSEAEARTLVDARGGLVAEGCHLFGSPAMGAPARRGDVGLLAVDGWHLGMICTGALWVIRAGELGIRFTRREPDVFWNLRFS